MTKPISRAAINAKLDQWATEHAITVCSLMHSGASSQLVQYPTGLLAVRATLGRQSCEVAPSVFETIKADGWKVRG